MDFRILGSLEVNDAGEDLTLSGGKQRALLALLVLHPNEILTSDRLIDALWGESPPPTAAKMLQNYVSQLRRDLSRGGSGEAPLQTRGNGYVLRLEPGDRDVDRFEELLRQGRSLMDDDPRAAARLLSDALALWRGDPLAEFSYDSFAKDEIARLQELRLVALEDRFDAGLALGRHAELIPELTRLAGEQPLRERLRAQLMLALYRSGRQAEALDAYQRARQALVDELGIEPGPALRELHNAILRQDAELGAQTRTALEQVRARGRGGLLIAAGGAILLAAAVVALVLALTGDSDPRITGGRALSGAVALTPANCSQLVAARGANPGFLIAGSLPQRGFYGALGTRMDAAIRYVIRERDFRAGGYSVGYQVCDDTTARGGIADRQRCESNAEAYARNASVIAVIGPFNSGCAATQLPITNRAGLAMLSPSNTYVGLTRKGPGAAPGDPDVLYPTRRRTYARIIPNDGVQAAAIALLARRLGIRRLLLLQGSGPYASGLVRGVRYAAERLGVAIVARLRWNPAGSAGRLTGRVARERPDGVFLGGEPGGNERELIHRLRADVPQARLLAPDAFAATPNQLVDTAGSDAEGMIVTIAGTPPEALGPRGRTFVSELSDHLGSEPDTYTVYAAQAAQAMLDAIARSDGTRASVVRELFRTRVRDGIVGSFALTREGDTTDRAITAYRIEGGRQIVFAVLRPPAPTLLPSG